MMQRLYKEKKNYPQSLELGQSSYRLSLYSGANFLPQNHQYSVRRKGRNRKKEI